MRDERPEHFRIVLRGMWAALISTSLIPHLLPRLLLNQAICITVLCLCYPLRQTVRLGVVCEHIEEFFRACGFPGIKPKRIEDRSPFDGSPVPRWILAFLFLQGLICVIGNDEIFRRVLFTILSTYCLGDELKQYCKKVATDREAELKQEAPIIWTFSRRD